MKRLFILILLAVYADSYPSTESRIRQLRHFTNLLRNATIYHPLGRKEERPEESLHVSSSSLPVEEEELGYLSITPEELTKLVYRMAKQLLKELINNMVNHNI